MRPLETPSGESETSVADLLWQEEVVVPLVHINHAIIFIFLFNYKMISSARGAISLIYILIVCWFFSSLSQALLPIYLLRLRQSLRLPPLITSSCIRSCRCRSTKWKSQRPNPHRGRVRKERGRKREEWEERKWKRAGEIQREESSSH